MNTEYCLTPKEIVAELDKYIIGQNDAKKAVATSLRNRWRRKHVDLPMRDEIVPKNILMVGPTGVGKTEIARRLARLINAPFIKIEATKFTEIGYVGRDVDSIIRDLLDTAIRMLKDVSYVEVKHKAQANAELRIINALVGQSANEETKDKFLRLLRQGRLSDREITVEMQDNASPFSSFELPGMQGAQMGMLNLGEVLGKNFCERTKSKTMAIPQAYDTLLKEESEKLLNEDKLIQNAINLVQQDGIVFLDEIDKISGKSDDSKRDVSREGVQRDLLPLIEGTTVSTKYGAIKTDHILFIASGAFYLSKPADLLPELQGRLPIRVELKPLTKEDMVRILKETEFSLIKQYQALLKTEGVVLEFQDCAVEALANYAVEFNREVEDIGARRLHTIMERLLEDISFDTTLTKGNHLNIDAAYVSSKLDKFIVNADLSKFIL